MQPIPGVVAQPPGWASSEMSANPRKAIYPTDGFGYPFDVRLSGLYLSRRLTVREEVRHLDGPALAGRRTRDAGTRTSRPEAS